MAGTGVLGYLLFRKTPDKYYSKARIAHKSGEECYANNDLDLAGEYYKDAEDFRMKARELAAKRGGKNA